LQRGIERGLCPTWHRRVPTVHKHRHRNQTCVEVKALMMGTGQDNPKNIHDILMADCTMYDRCPDNRLSPASDKQPPPDRRPGRDYLRRRLIRASNWRVPRYRRPGEAAGPGSPSCFSPLSANTSERSNRTLTPPRPPAPSDVAIPLDGAKIGLFQLRCERGLRVHLQGWPNSVGPSADGDSTAVIFSSMDTPSRTASSLPRCRLSDLATQKRI